MWRRRRLGSNWQPQWIICSTSWAAATQSYNWNDQWQQMPIILALHHSSSRATTLMRAMRNPNVWDWLTSLAGKFRERETQDPLRCQVWMQKHRPSSLHVQKCWNKELFLHFKVLLPAASITIFRKSSNHDRDGKTTSEPRQWALETSHLGKKYNTALGIYHVYIINCAIYNTLMKDDEIISHLQRKRKKYEINYSLTALFYSITSIRLILPINYTPYVAKELNTKSYRGRRSCRLTAGSYLARIKTVCYFPNSILWIIKDIKSLCNSKKMACRAGDREEVKSF